MLSEGKNAKHNDRRGVGKGISAYSSGCGVQKSWIRGNWHCAIVLNPSNHATLTTDYSTVKTWTIEMMDNQHGYDSFTKSVAQWSLKSSGSLKRTSLISMPPREPLVLQPASLATTLDWMKHFANVCREDPANGKIGICNPNKLGFKICRNSGNVKASKPPDCWLCTHASPTMMLSPRLSQVKTSDILELVNPIHKVITPGASSIISILLESKSPIHLRHGFISR